MAELLAYEGIDSQLGRAHWVVDVNVESFKRGGLIVVNAIVQMPEVGPCLEAVSKDL